MREKLIELLRAVQYQGNAIHGYHDRYIQNSELADHLLANGVTLTDTNVGKWIPVTEETPAESKDVLLLVKSQTTGTTAVTVGYCFTYYWCHQPMGLRWYERWRASYEPAGGVLDDSWDVTHWMKLPKEPKEDANG
jgi:hypothetical protein